MPYLIGATAPGGYDNVIAPPGGAELERGDILMMDTGAARDGYFADFDRNFAIGVASAASCKAYDTLFAATEAGLNAARPGATCGELFEAMQRVISEAGYAAGNSDASATASECSSPNGHRSRQATGRNWCRAWF